jgi:hypothetical protein
LCRRIRPAVAPSRPRTVALALLRAYTLVMLALLALKVGSLITG